MSVIQNMRTRKSLLTVLRIPSNQEYDISLLESSMSLRKSRAACQGVGRDNTSPSLVKRHETFDRKTAKCSDEYSLQ